MTESDFVGAAPQPDGPVSVIDYSERIPNNVDLATDRKLQRALESWQPRFLDWWAALGPSLPTRDVYLRTAVAIGRDGWASWARVPMEQYRWGIFLSERGGEPRQIGPASVEQQRHLGATAPSLYDLRNLFQVNVEEGRHLWAMVYLLHAYFGRDGREEAEQLLRRHSGHPDSPRILGAFNEETTDWLSFFMFTYFTDRDGKYQLGTLKESGFDPLSRTCEFMLREEAHHMFVGTTGVQRVVQRTAAVMAEHDGDDDVWACGAVPLSVIQKYLNLQYSLSLDLFGSETSSNAAAYFTAGLKGRWMESRRHDDHVLTDATAQVPLMSEGAVSSRTVPALTALNLDLRDEYVGGQLAADRRRPRTGSRAHGAALRAWRLRLLAGAAAGRHQRPAGRVRLRTVLSLGACPYASFTQVVPPRQNHRFVLWSTNRSPFKPDVGCEPACGGS